MDEKPEQKRRFGAFSAREIFYFFFALLAFGVLAFVFTVQTADRREEAARERKAKRDAKLEKVRKVVYAIRNSGGCVISDTQVLHPQLFGTNLWSLYDIQRDEITDGSHLAWALDKPGPYHDALMVQRKLPTRGSMDVFSGWNGNLVLTIPDLSGESVIFQWRTNSDELRVSKLADSGGNIKFSHIEPAVAVGDGWDSFADFLGSNGVRVMLVANRNNHTTTTLLPTNVNFSWNSGFQDGIYSVSRNSNGITAEVEIFSLTNQSIIFSNAAVRMPRKYDALDARPDPIGKRVLWMFGVEPKLNAKLRSILPAAIAPAPAGRKWYLYYSDLHATKFKFVCVAEGGFGYFGSVNSFDRPPQFLWGMNGDSIWLLDDDEGIKRVELK